MYLGITDKEKSLVVIVRFIKGSKVVEEKKTEVRVGESFKRESCSGKVHAGAATCGTAKATAKISARQRAASQNSVRFYPARCHLPLTRCP